MARQLPAVAALLLCVAAVMVLPAQAQDVDVVSYFPDTPTKEFFPGKLVTAVLGVRNTGATPVNVSYAAANLASPYNASLNIYNFTGAFLGNTQLNSGEETNVEYSIFFPRQLPPREFILKMQLYYAVGQESYLSKLFYNETINVIEEATWFDTQLIGLVLIGLAAGAAALYAAVEFGKSKGWIKKTKKAVKKAAPATAANKSEWLAGTAYAAEQRRKAGKQG